MKTKKIVAILILLLAIIGIPIALLTMHKPEEQAKKKKLSGDAEVAALGKTKELTNQNVKSNGTSNSNAPDPSQNKHKLDKKFEKPTGKLLEIKEKFFISQINDIFYNFEQYKNTRVRVEGMYDFFQMPKEKEPIQMVYRNGPGCCGNDGWAGFLLKFNTKVPKLKPNDWIEVEGRPELDNTEDFQDLYLVVDKITVKTKRGSEFVAN